MPPGRAVLMPCLPVEHSLPRPCKWHGCLCYPNSAPQSSKNGAVIAFIITANLPTSRDALREQGNVVHDLRVALNAFNCRKFMSQLGLLVGMNYEHRNA